MDIQFIVIGEPVSPDGRPHARIYSLSSVRSEFETAHMMGEKPFTTSAGEPESVYVVGEDAKAHLVTPRNVFGSGTFNEQDYANPQVEWIAAESGDVLATTTYTVDGRS